MFRALTPNLVIAQCRAGIIGALPSRSVRQAADLPAELARIRRETREGCPPFAINLVADASNGRFEADLDACVAARVPIIITSLGASAALVDRVHGYGGHLLHDASTIRNARKAILAGVDGIVAVCAGAGGNTGIIAVDEALGRLNGRQEQ